MDIFSPSDPLADEVLLAPSLSAADIAEEFADKEKSRNFPYVMCQIWMNTVRYLLKYAYENEEIEVYCKTVRKM